MYLWQVKLAVEESLPPALRDYARRQAQLEVQVERVRLGWNRILLTYPDVRTLSGERLLRARYLEMRLPADGAPLTIELDRPEVWLQRNRQGIWNIDPLLRQPRPPEPTPFTFRVRAQGGTLYFDDLLPDAPVRATLWAQEFTLSQPRIGQAITLQGVSDALGDVQARALSDGKRWLIEIDAAQVQGARFKPYLPRTEFDLAQVTGQVSLQIVYAPDQPLQVQGTAQGVAQGATYRRRPLPWREAAFALAFTESHIGGELTARDGSLRVQGVVDWSGRTVQVDAQAQAVGRGRRRTVATAARRPAEGAGTLSGATAHSGRAGQPAGAGNGRPRTGAHPTGRLAQPPQPCRLRGRATAAARAVCRVRRAHRAGQTVAGHAPRHARTAPVRAGEPPAPAARARPARGATRRRGGCRAACLRTPRRADGGGEPADGRAALREPARRWAARTGAIRRRRADHPAGDAAGRARRSVPVGRSARPHKRQPALRPQRGRQRG
jgi:hypothetical protein